MNKGPAIGALLLAGAIAGGLTAGAIFGQSGEPVDPYVNPPPQRTPVASPGPKLADDPCDDPKQQRLCEEVWGLPGPEPRPSPHAASRTDVAPIPFDTALRDDCPQGWDSIGEPGVFAICYRPDMWEARALVTGQTEDWIGNARLGYSSDELVGITVSFYPRGTLDETDICATGFVTEPVEPVKIGPHEGVTCAGEAIGKWRSYRIEQETSLGLVRATGTLPYTPDDAYPGLHELLGVMATLRVDP